MIIKTIPTGMIEENCYIVMDENTNEGFLVDPGADAQILANAVENMKMKPKFILLTHGHWDHVGAVVELKDKFNIPFYISTNDNDMIQSGQDTYGSTPNPDGYLKEGDTFKFADKTIRVIETPGHTPGGVCFLVDKSLFTGDTLFNGTIGRTDFVGGSFETLVSSVRRKLATLPEDIKVYPGHGPSTTIGLEKRQNPYILGDNYVY
ncbi:MBL fold metallo-hydrolase [Clostridium mediterraneense]|uniref:MBL fold metallo-hydrolase n=1 Tax=Clostridium mediterraneense TaxID=1805472 RepID=UPI0008350D69|nr:MBL fold metallo-hydrolase [Clostridium mediterraneense]